MKIDITLRVTPQTTEDAQGNLKKAMTGHLGTHFDEMNKEFPLEYTERRAVVFDISHIKDREIGPLDIDLDKVETDMFVAFYSGYIEEEGYGTQKYFKEHPQLSPQLMDAVILGCTELPLVFEHILLPVEKMDVMQIHIQTLCKLIMDE